MRIVYKGIFDEVIVPDWADANGYPQAAKRGEALDCPDALAARLLEQTDNWAKAPAAGGRKTGPTSTEG